MNRDHRLARLRWIGAAALSGIGLSAALAACGAVLPGVGQSPYLYTLSPKTTFSNNLPRVEWQLVIEEPIAAGGLDTNRIAVKPTPFELKYFSDSRWTERAPKMVQTLLVESFENTGRIIAVGREVVGLRSDYNLKSELREFQAEYYGDDGTASNKPVVRVRLNAKMIRQPRQEIVASRNFEYSIAVKSNAMSDIVEGFDEALGKVIRRSVEWVLQSPLPPAEGSPGPAALPRIAPAPNGRGASKISAEN